MSRLSFASVAILQALAAGHGHGFDVMSATGLPSGTIYPALRRMEKHGLIRGRWEREDEARDAKRPRRRYYEVTRAGAETLEAALDRFHALRRLEPAPRES